MHKKLNRPQSRNEYSEYSFGVFLKSHFAPLALSSVDDPKKLPDQQGNPTDLLWCKKRYVTDRGIQPTSFGATYITSPTGESNLPLFR